VTSRHPRGQPGTLMRMPDEADMKKESEPAEESYPIILRSYEPVADLDYDASSRYSASRLLKKRARRDIAVRAPRHP
jgi:hypothetical protein